MLLHRAAEGDSTAVRTLLPLVYDELRALAGARLALQASGHTLQATALVHEAYLKLVSGTKGDEIGFASRAQFFAAAARSMRNILVDHARAKLAIKRGGDQKREALDENVLGLETDPGEILALHELLSALEKEDAAEGEHCFDEVLRGDDGGGDRGGAGDERADGGAGVAVCAGVDAEEVGEGKSDEEERGSWSEDVGESW